jgi:hypothetical protein
MATPAVQQFHNDNMRQERERVLLRIANGTKASSPNVISIRQSHPTYKGLPDNSTGSRTMPFFASKDESHCPIEEKIRMRGGVLHTKAGKEYGYEILKRRARDDINQRAAVEGLPPTPAPLTELSEEESKSLELDQLLNALNDAIATGDVRAINQSINITLLPRLMVALAPTFSGAKLGALESFISDMWDKLATQYQPNGRNMESINAEITEDLAAEGVVGDAFDLQLRTRKRKAQKEAVKDFERNKASIARIANLLTDTLAFIKALAKALSRGLEGKSLRTFIVAAAKEAFKMGRTAANRYIEVGYEASPVQRAEMAGAFAGQDEFPENDEFLSMGGVPSSRATTVFDDEEAGERKEVEEEDDDDDDDDDDEAPGGAAAGEPRFTMMYKIGDKYYDMSQGANYEEWAALRPEVGNARKAFDAMTRGRLQAGDTKEQAMAYVIQRKSNA